MTLTQLKISGWVTLDKSGWVTQYGSTWVTLSPLLTNNWHYFLVPVRRSRVNTAYLIDDMMTFAKEITADES